MKKDLGYDIHQFTNGEWGVHAAEFVRGPYRTEASAWRAAEARNRTPSMCTSPARKQREAESARNEARRSWSLRTGRPESAYPVQRIGADLDE